MDIFEKKKIHAQFTVDAVDSVHNVPSNSLMCHLSTHCSNVLRLNSMDLQKDGRGKKVFCPYCFVPWNRGSFSVKVLPRKKKGKKIRKILRRLSANKKLSVVQKNLASKFRPGNTVLLKCEVCKKATDLETDKIASGPPKPEIQFNAVDNVTPNKKKKKKKKSLFSGLNKNAVAQVMELEDGRLKNVSGDSDIKILDDISASTSKAAKRKFEGDLDQMESSKKIIRVNQKSSEIKTNCLNVTPLGLPKEFDLSNVKGSDVDFIALSDEPVEKNGKFAQRISGRKKCSGPRKEFINPFSNALEGMFSKKNRGKKLSVMKMLIAEEETKPQGSSLKNFLVGL